MGEVKFCLFKPQDKLMWECLRNLEEIVSLPASSSFFFFFIFIILFMEPLWWALVLASFFKKIIDIFLFTFHIPFSSFLSKNSLSLPYSPCSPPHPLPLPSPWASLPRRCYSFCLHILMMSSVVCLTMARVPPILSSNGLLVAYRTQQPRIRVVLFNHPAQSRVSTHWVMVT